MDQNPNEILLTGAHGLIGTCLRRRHELAFTFTALDRTAGVDLLDEQALEKAVAAHPGARVMIHLAAFTDVSAAHAQTGDTQGACWRLNVLGTRHAAAACRRHGLFLVHVSTDFIFDGQSDHPYTESSLPSPIEWYGQTKRWAEDEAMSAPRWAIVRIAFPYVTPPAARPDLVQKLAAALRQGRTLTMVDDQIITPTFGGDIADGLAALAREQPAGALFHLTGSSALTPHALGLLLAVRLGCRAQQVQRCSLQSLLARDPRPRQRALHVDNSRWSAWAQAHGLARPLTLEQGLEQVLAGA